MGGSDQRRGNDSKISSTIVSTVIAGIIASAVSIYAAVAVHQSKIDDQGRRLGEVERKTDDDHSVLIELRTDVKWIREKMAQKNP